MNENLDNLERDVESMPASLADDLSVEPSETAVSRVRAAVQYELDEAWLADQDESAPSPLVVERVRSAVREELAGQTDASSVRSLGEAMTTIRFPWVRVAAALTAAAIIAIGFGVIRFGSEVVVETESYTKYEEDLDKALEPMLDENDPYRYLGGTDYNLVLREAIDFIEKDRVMNPQEKDADI